MKLRIVPEPQGCLEQYVEWCGAHGQQVPAHFPRASAHIWVEAEGHGLVLGVGLYESPVFVLAEDMMGKPGTPAWVMHKAVTMAAWALVSHCTLVAKFPVIHTTRRSVVQVMRRVGFEMTNFVTMTRVPFHQMAVVPKQRKPKSPEKPTKKRAPAKRRKTGPRRKT